MKNKISFEIGRTSAEIKEALVLSHKVFNSRFATDYNFKAKSWLKNQIKNQEVALCKVNNEIVGVIRIIPLCLRLGDENVNVACLTSVCVNENFRGLNLSSKLMKFTITHCRKIGLEFQLVVASRNVDHYYLRFGFEGISSYQAVTVKPTNKKSLKLKVRKNFSFENINKYSKMYKLTYSSSSGSRVRSLDDWAFIQKKIKMDSIDFYECYENEELIAYVAKLEDKIIEVSFKKDSYAQSVVCCLLEKFKINLKFEVSFSHVINTSLSGFDCTWETRHCVYGGHMIAASEVKQRRKIEALLYKGIPEVGKVSFNLPYFDRF